MDTIEKISDNTLQGRTLGQQVAPEQFGGGTEHVE